MATTSTALGASLILFLLGLQIATCARCFDNFEFLAMKENQRHTIPHVGYSSVVGQQLTVTKMRNHFLIVFKVHNMRHRPAVKSQSEDFGLSLWVHKSSGTGYDAQMAAFVKENRTIFRGLVRVAINFNAHTTEDSIKETLDKICANSFLKSYSPFETMDESQIKAWRALDYLYHWNGKAHAHIISQRLGKEDPVTLYLAVAAEIKKMVSLCYAHGVFSDKFNLLKFRGDLGRQRDIHTGVLDYKISKEAEEIIDADLGFLNTKVSAGHYATTLTGFGQRMADLAGMLYLYHGSSSAAVKSVLNGGALLSREVLHKRMLLNGFKGKSGNSDEASGGASYVFLRAATSRLIAAGAKLGKYSDTDDGATLFFPVAILDRMDWFAYTRDAYGATNTEEYKNRMPTAVMMLELKGVTDSRNEIMIRDTLSTDLAMMITVKNKALFEEIKTLATSLRSGTIVARSNSALREQMRLPSLSSEGIPRIPPPTVIVKKSKVQMPKPSLTAVKPSVTRPLGQATPSQFKGQAPKTLAPLSSQSRTVPPRPKKTVTVSGQPIKQPAKTTLKKTTLGK